MLLFCVSVIQPHIDSGADEVGSRVAATFETGANTKNSVSHALQLRDALEDEIVNGVLKPGDRLDEAALAERFKVSRCTWVSSAAPVSRSIRTISPPSSCAA